MNLLSDPIWIPLSHRFLNGVAIGSVVLAVLFVVFWVQWRKGVALWLLRLREKLGLTELNPWLVGGLGLVWALLFAVFLLAMFWVVIGILGRVGAATPEEGSDLRWSLLTLTAMTASLGAVISLPFTLIRVTLNRRQTETDKRRADDQFQGQITDRINKAVEGLGAEKVESRLMQQVSYETSGTAIIEVLGRGDQPTNFVDPDTEEYGDWQVIQRTVPNLEVRIGAIYALERIAQDSNRDHVQIMEILCAYIRENAPAKDAEPWPKLPIDEFEDDGPLTEGWEERLQEFREEQGKKIDGLTCRTDIQTAITVIGRRTDKQRQWEARKHRDDKTAVFVFDLPCPDPTDFIPDDYYDGDQLVAYEYALNDWKARLTSYSAYRLDLRNTNLRGADMSSLELSGALFDRSELQGANLAAAQMQGANLEAAQIQGVYLEAAQMQGAVLGMAHMQGAYIRRVRMEGADLREAQMQEANFWEAQMQGADLREAQMQGAALGKAQMQGAYLGNVQMQGAYLRKARMQGVVLGVTQMQGSDLRDAQMQGTDLSGARMDGNTKLTGANLRGAAVRNVRFKNVPQIVPHLADLFGDGTVKLPQGEVAVEWPKHWPQVELDRFYDDDGVWIDRFEQEWREWQKDPNGYKPPER